MLYAHVMAFRLARSSVWIDFGSESCLWVAPPVAERWDEGRNTKPLTPLCRMSCCVCRVVLRWSDQRHSSSACLRCVSLFSKLGPSLPQPVDIMKTRASFVVGSCVVIAGTKRISLQLAHTCDTCCARYHLLYHHPSG